MGNHCATSTSPLRLKEKQRSSSIEKSLREEKKKRIIKVLFLGIAESGKSTLLKQIEILYQNRFSLDSERIPFVNLIRKRIVDSIISLVDASVQYCGEYPFLEGNAALASRVLEEFSLSPELRPELASIVKILWKDPLIRNYTYSKRYDFHLCDDARYFLDDIDRITSDGYIPTKQDILYCRIPNQGIKQIQMEDKDHNDVIWLFVDVAGQRCKRRNWVQYFDNVSCIVYCVAISDYVKKSSLHRGATNSIEESLMVFKETLSDPAFADTPVILLLNKIDLFREYLKTFDFSSVFSKYNLGDQVSFDDASQFIESLFVDICQSSSSLSTSNDNHQRSRSVHVHFTCALDSLYIHQTLSSIFSQLTETCLISYEDSLL